MGNNSLKLALVGENDPIWSWAATGIDLVAAQDRKLIVRFGVWEAEAFVIIVYVWVTARC